MDTQEKTLEQYAKDYAYSKNELLSTEKDYKEMREGDPRHKEMKESWETVKRLREEIKNDPDIKATKERIDKLKGDMKLYEEMIIFRMREQQLTLFPLEDQGEFILKDKLKYKKKRKKKAKWL